METTSKKGFWWSFSLITDAGQSINYSYPSPLLYLWENIRRPQKAKFISQTTREHFVLVLQWERRFFFYLSMHKLYTHFIYYYLFWKRVVVRIYEYGFYNIFNLNLFYDVMVVHSWRISLESLCLALEITKPEMIFQWWVRGSAVHVVQGCSSVRLI